MLARLAVKEIWKINGQLAQYSTHTDILSPKQQAIKAEEAVKMFYVGHCKHSITSYPSVSQKYYY